MRLNLLVLLAMGLTACAGILPSVCDDTGESSVICSTAATTGVRIESVGAALTLANTLAIERGAYTKAQAVAALEGVSEVLDGPVAYSFLKSRLDIDPLLFAVLSPYVQSFTTDSLVLPKDRRLMLAWINSTLEALE
jgi:hypothetical protein